MNNSCLKIKADNSDTLVVSFAGHNIMFGSMLAISNPFEFLNFFNRHFNNVNRHFYVDINKTSYHKGIEGISKNIDETVQYLKKEIANYKNVIFIGASSGGYAAILFGSLLNVQSVVAFTPQTVRLDKHIDEKYRDISPYINNTTNYYLYGDLSIKNEKDTHHISHCNRISHHPNVYIKRVAQFNLKYMRDNSELYGIFSNLIYNR
jgi:hypothetical protein